MQNVFVNHEALVFKRGRILPGALTPNSVGARHFRRPSRYGWFLIKNYWLRRGYVDIPEGLWAIDNSTPGNYHHWVIDTLPRLLFAERELPRADTLLLPRYYTEPYIPFTLQAFPHVRRIGWIGSRAKVRVRQLSFTPRQEAAEHVEMIPEIARRVSALAPPAPERCERLYITRAEARTRRALNEGALRELLDSYGFRCLEIDPARPWEQVSLASGAKVMLGVHGAGLTNVIFMPPGGALIELRHGQPSFRDHHYRPLASITGLDYHPVICDTVGDGPPNDADLGVDLAKVRATLDAALS
jgi:capsular polysaccharide biosynthesis protein